MNQNIPEKILFVIPSLVGGGAERALINLLNHMDYSRYTIHLAVIYYNGVYVEHVPTSVKKIVPLFKNVFLVRVLSYLQKKVGFSFIFRWVLSRKLTENYENAVSFLDGNFTDLLFFIKAKRRITWVHASYKSNSNYYRFYQNALYVDKLKQRRYGPLDAIVFVSEDCKREFIEIFGVYKNMPVVYNFIDQKSVLHKSVLFNVSKRDVFHFMAMGSLLPVKGFDRLIRASRKLKEDGFKFHVTILGEGYERHQLQKLIESCSLVDDVTLLGFQSNPYPFIKSCDAFVMSSISEALPTALIEAMVIGKPVIVTDCSGCNEIVDAGNYGLVSSQDDFALARAMEVFLQDSSLVSQYAFLSKQRALFFNDSKVLTDYYSVLSFT